MFRKPLAGAALALALCAPAIAAPTANSVITAQTPNRGVVNFVQGTDAAGTYKSIYTGGTNGSICRGAVLESNNDGSATHAITLAVNVSSTDYPFLVVTTAANDGYANGSPPKNLLSSTFLPALPLDSDGNYYVFLGSGDKLEAQYATALTSSDRINIYAPSCADF